MVNIVVVSGRLGADPEVRADQNGGMIAKLRLAVNDKYRSKAGELVERTDWVNVTAFGQQAETAGKYLVKGREVLVVGRLSVRQWDADDGTKRTAYEVVASRINFLGSKPGGSDAAPATVGEDDDLPF